MHKVTIKHVNGCDKMYWETYYRGSCYDLIVHLFAITSTYMHRRAQMVDLLKTKWMMPGMVCVCVCDRHKREVKLEVEKEIVSN